MPLSGNESASANHYPVMTSNSTFRRRANGSVAPAVATPSSVSQSNRRSLSARADVETTLDGWLRTGSRVSVCIFAVDGFATYTETFGLQEQRQMLSRLCALVLSNVRAEDVLGPVGDGRFALLLPGTPETGALLVAERLLLVCRVAAWNCAPISLSIGVVCAQAGSLAAESLEVAESAVARALQAGGARVFTVG